jgi:starch synthase
VRVLHVSAEVAPYAKTGGLADVLGSLPRALQALGVEVTVVAPRYRSIERARLRSRGALLVERFGERVEILEAEPGIFFVDHPLYDRDGLYGPPGGGDFPDNARRFGLLDAAALALADRLDRWPDVLHGHDWQAGAALVYARSPPPGRVAPATVFTVHNLAYQGLFPPATVDELALGWELYTPEGFEFWGHVSLL